MSLNVFSFLLSLFTSECLEEKLLSDRSSLKGGMNAQTSILVS